MDVNDFRDAYARLEDRVVAGDALKERALEAAALSSKAASRRRRTAAKAIAACLAVLAGVALLAPATGLLKVEEPLSAGGFVLTALASEGSTGADRTVGIGLDSFHPVRTSAGYLYDAASDSVTKGVATADRYYQIDLTVGGEGITKVEYELDGPGVSFSGQSGQEPDGASGDASAFTTSASGEAPTFGEIRLSYVLDGEEKAEFDALYDVSDSWGLETLLAVCDAKRLSETTLTVTCTFDDGSTATKSYGFVPEEDYATMYRSYLESLDGRLGDAWCELADEPSLFRLAELS